MQVLQQRFEFIQQLIECFHGLLYRKRRTHVPVSYTHLAGFFIACEKERFTPVSPYFAHVFGRKSGQLDRWFCMIWYLKENLRQSLLRVVPFLK